MAEVSFGTQEGSTPVEQVEVMPAAPVPQVPATTTAEVPARRMRLGDELPGFKDVILPRLNIVQNMGQLKDSHPVGAIVFNQRVPLFTPPVVKNGTVEKSGTPPVNITVLGIVSKRYAEKVSGIGGLIVNTEDDVRAAGGTLDYKEWELKKASGMRRFEPLADLLVVIRKPENFADEDHTIFGHDVDGSHYVLALWAVKGSAYTAAMKRVFNYERLSGCLKEGYPTCNFSLTTRYETWNNGNSAWIPVCIPNKKNTPKFMEFVHQIIEG